MATVDGQEVWLHPQHKRSENRRLLSGKTALRIDKDGYSFVDIPYSGAAENGIGLFCTLNLGEGGKGEGKATLKLTGYFNPCYLMQSEEEKKEYFTKVVANMFKNAEVKDYDLRLLTPTATEVALSFEVSNLTSETDRYVYLSLKNPYLFSYDFDISLIREKRQTPLELPTTFQTDLKALIRFPEQWKVIYLPEGIDLENEVASLWVHYAAESSQISIAKRLTVKNRNVSAEDYPKLRSLLLSGGIEKSNTVIFRLP